MRVDRRGSEVTLEEGGPDSYQCSEKASMIVYQVGAKEALV